MPPRSWRESLVGYFFGTIVLGLYRKRSGGMRHGQGVMPNAGSFSIEFHVAFSRPQQGMKMGWASPVEGVTSLGFRTHDRVCILPRRGTTNCDTRQRVST